MSTTDDTNATRRGSESNDLLGRLVDAEMAAYSDAAYAEHGSARDQLERFAADVQAAERQRWIAKAGAAYTDAHAIFNDPPSETPQVVRDVIEWHLHTMRANEEA